MDSNGNTTAASKNEEENDGQEKYIDVTASSDSPSQRASPRKQPGRAESDTESDATGNDDKSNRHSAERSRGRGRPRRDLQDTADTSSKPVGTSDTGSSDVANAPIYGGLQVLGQAVESATLASLRDPPSSGGTAARTADTSAPTGDTGHAEQAPASAMGGGGEPVASRRSSARKRTPTSKVQSSTALEDDQEDYSADGQHSKSSPPAAGGGAGKQGSETTATAKSSASSSGGGSSQSGKKRRAGSQGAGKASKRGGGKAKAKKQLKRRRLHLQPPKFDVEQHGGGTIRKRYSLDFKIKVAKYALSKDPNGQAKGGTIGPRYAAIQLGIPEAQSVREWMRRLPEMEAALSDAQELGGASWSHHMASKKSFSLGKAPLTLGIEDQLIAYIQEVKAKGEIPVSSRLLKEKAEELRPGVFGIAPDDDVVAIRKYEGKINSWCHRFLRRHRISGVNEGPLRRRTFGTVASRAVSSGGGFTFTPAPPAPPALPGLVASAAGAIGIASAPSASPPQVPPLAAAASPTAYTSPLAANTAIATTTTAAAVAAAATITIKPSASNSVVHGTSPPLGAAAVGGPRIVAATNYLGLPAPAPPAQPGHVSWPLPAMNLASFPSLATASTTRDGTPALTKQVLQGPVAQHTAAPSESGLVPSESGAVPNDTGAMPNDTGAMPNDTGAMPNNTGAVPNDSGAEPNDGGAEPDESDSPVRVDDDDDA